MARLIEIIPALSGQVTDCFIHCSKRTIDSQNRNYLSFLLQELEWSAITDNNSFAIY